MNAGQYLLAKSSLASGTAAAHLLSLIATGSGLVVNDGIDVELSTMQITVELDDSPVSVEIADTPVEVELSTTEIIVEIAT